MISYTLYADNDRKKRNTIEEGYQGVYGICYCVFSHVDKHTDFIIKHTSHHSLMKVPSLALKQLKLKFGRVFQPQSTMKSSTTAKNSLTGVKTFTYESIVSLRLVKTTSVNTPWIAVKFRVARATYSYSHPDLVWKHPPAHSEVDL